MTDGAPDGPAASALLVAAARALAEGDPIGEVLCRDPYARLFVDADALAGAGAHVGFARNVWLRTRYIDDVVRAHAASHPGGQVLLLGAGLDARAFRLDVDARFHEVDRPASMAWKARVLASHGVTDPPGRVTVGADLAVTPLAEALAGSGFDRAAPTCVVSEGLTFYLDDDALVRGTAELVATLEGGATLVADHSLPAPTDEPIGDGGARAVRSRIRRRGERFHRRSLAYPAVLADAGFTVVDDECTDLLLARYGLGPGERRYPARILTATLPAR